MTLKHRSFIVTGAILIVAVVAVAAYYGANVGNAQDTNMMKNMSRSIKMLLLVVTRVTL